MAQHPNTTTSYSPEKSGDGTDPAEPVASTDHLVEEELLVEDVSIDGMCGVY